METSITHGPAWAFGCVHCTYGVKDEYYQPPTGQVELWLERLVMAERVGPEYFCDCRAGQALRSFLRRMREQYQARLDKFGAQDVAMGEIVLAQARHALAQAEPERQEA